MSRFLRPFLFATLLLAPVATIRAGEKADGPLPRQEMDRRLSTVIRNTVNHGADIFNAGNHEGCYRLYQGTLWTLLPMLDHRPELKAKAEEKVRKAETLRKFSDQAFLLREVLDEVRGALSRETVVAPPEKPRSLYDRLGGEAAIKAVVDDFVARAAADSMVNFTRKGTDVEWEPTPGNVERLKKSLIRLVGMVCGGPQKYEGRSMKAAHRGMKISNAEFDALAADLKASLDKFKVPQQEQDELLKIVGTTRADIVEQK